MDEIEPGKIVPPGTFRLIGDHLRGDEWFIPLTSTERSVEILRETARRMGFPERS